MGADNLAAILCSPWITAEEDPIKTISCPGAVHEALRTRLSGTFVCDADRRVPPRTPDQGFWLRRLTGISLRQLGRRSLKLWEQKLWR